MLIEGLPSLPVCMAHDIPVSFNSTVHGGVQISLGSYMMVQNQSEHEGLKHEEVCNSDWQTQCCRLSRRAPLEMLHVGKT